MAISGLPFGRFCSYSLNPDLVRTRPGWLRRIQSVTATWSGESSFYDVEFLPELSRRHEVGSYSRSYEVDSERVAWTRPVVLCIVTGVLLFWTGTADAASGEGPAPCIRPSPEGPDSFAGSFGRRRVSERDRPSFHGDQPSGSIVNNRRHRLPRGHRGRCAGASG